MQNANTYFQQDAINPGDDLTDSQPEGQQDGRSESRKNAQADVRRQRLRAWMKERDVDATQLAKRLNVARSYVYLLFNPERFFGEKAARTIEGKLGLPTGWLDSEVVSEYVQIQDWDELSRLDDEAYAVVPTISLDDGQPIRRPPITMRVGALKDKGIRRRDALRVWTKLDDDMAPYLQRGDLVIVDCDQTRIVDGEVYAIRYGNAIRVRRLRARFDGGLLITADALPRGDEILTAQDMQHVQVIGRVVMRAG